MPLPPLLQRLWRRPSDVDGPKADAAAGKAPPEASDLARTQARRRLIGAAVLLLLAVVVFPLVFETQPRPLPLDTPIQFAKGSPPAAAGTVVRPVTPRAPAPETTASGPVAAPVEPVPADAAASAADSATKPPLVPTVRADAAPASAAASAAAVEGARFVVQVGAFADTSQVRDLRARLDKLGLRKHYVQAVEVKGGTRMNRVRLGPYATRDEAASAAARLKDAGLPGQVLEL